MASLLVDLPTTKTYLIAANTTRTIQADAGEWWAMTDGGPLYVASSTGAGSQETQLAEGAARWPVTTTPQAFVLRDSGLSVLNETGSPVALTLARVVR